MMTDFQNSFTIGLSSNYCVTKWSCLMTWTLLQEDLRKLEVFHMRSQRMILGIRWHDFVRNTEVVDRTNCPCLQDVIAKRRNSFSAMWWDSMTTRQPTAHYHRSQQQELAPALVLVGGDGQDARAIHGSSSSVTVHPSAFVPNGPRLVVVAILGWRNGPLLSTRSDDDGKIQLLNVKHRIKIVSFEKISKAGDVRFCAMHPLTQNYTKFDVVTHNGKGAWF